VATHDYVVSNGTGNAVRSDLNGALAAIVSQNSSASAPATMYAYMLWADTTAGIMKMRNGANSAWISLWELDGTFIATDISLSAGTAGAPSLYFTGDTNTGIYSPGADQVAISTNGTGRLFVDASGNVTVPAGGNVGINGAAPQSPLDVISNASGYGISLRGRSGDSLAQFRFTSNNHATIYALLETAPTYLAAQVNGSERARITSDGKLLVGTSTSTGFVPPGESFTTAATVQVSGSSGAGSSSYQATDTNAGDYSLGGSIFLNKRPNNDTGIGSGHTFGSVLFAGWDTAALRVGASIRAASDGQVWASGDCPSRLVFFTTAGGAASPTERMRITSNGDLLLGSTPPTSNGRLTLNVAAAGNNAVAVRNTASTADHWTLFIGTNATTAGWNGAATINYCSRDTGTGRSINAAGTVNASGADYAEYIIKAGSFDIAKGDVCGMNSGGMLTNIFADAIGFVVKSTNPSYVGGDTWGNADAIGERPSKNEDGEVDQQALSTWEAALETERQKVDRIAFAGQVPVNVMGATPGQYIVPVEAADGGIEGVAKSEADLTLAEYMRAVGKVIAIEDDGRARIIVKVA